MQKKNVSKNGGWNGLAIAIIQKYVDTRSNPVLEWECPGYSSVEIQIPCSDIYLLTCMVKNKITRIGGCQVDAEIDVFTIKYEYTRCTGWTSKVDSPLPLSQIHQTSTLWGTFRSMSRSLCCYNGCPWSHRERVRLASVGHNLLSRFREKLVRCVWVGCVSVGVTTCEQHVLQVNMLANWYYSVPRRKIHRHIITCHM